MELKLKEQPQNDSPIVKMIFQTYNPYAQKCEPFGSMVWNGKKWEIEIDTNVNAVRTFYTTNTLNGALLTQDDYDLYVPFLASQGSILQVKGLSESFCNENKELLSSNPLLKDDNGFELSI